jgi:hypothetical protein
MVPEYQRQKHLQQKLYLFLVRKGYQLLDSYLSPKNKEMHQTNLIRQLLELVHVAFFGGTQDFPLHHYYSINLLIITNKSQRSPL